MFGKTASVCFILALEMASLGNQHCADCIGKNFGPYEEITVRGITRFLLWGSNESV